MSLGRFLGGLCFAGVLGLIGVAAVFAIRAKLRLRRMRLGGDPRTARRVRQGRGLPLDQLAKRLSTTPDALRGARCSYREVSIPKRRGGMRHLLVPDDVTKAMQRRILRRVLVGLRSHPAATGFERGKSIVDHAAPHAGRAVVVNERVRLPREIRRRLRATRHRMGKGLAPLQGEAAAQGWFAYEKMVEEQAKSRAAAAAAPPSPR